MKKLLLTALVLLTANSSFAVYADSQDLKISGEVVAVNELQIRPIGNDQLNLGVNTSNQKVAEVDEKSNSITGYKISISSANGYKLKREGAAPVGITTTDVSYTLKYDGVTLIPGSAAKTTGALSQVTEDMSEVSVSYTGNTTLVAGVYSDTLTISISAN